MPTGQQYSSVATQAQLTAGISNANLTCTVNTTSGFPAFPFTGVFDIGTASQEIVDVTNVSGLTLTITRGVDGSAAQNHSNGATFTHSAIARDLREARAHIDASSSNDSTGHSVHGIAVGSSVVGTTDSQTLTNKTLTSPTIAGPSITGTVSGGATYTAPTLNNASVSTTAVGTIPLTIKGIASETADLLRVQDNTPTNLFKVMANGATGAGAVSIQPTDTGTDSLTINSPSSLSGNIVNFGINSVSKAHIGASGQMSLTPGPLSVGGLTGAATASRYVGATTGGPPTTGTFSTGDWVVDTKWGINWTCTAGGTPGTWAGDGIALLQETILGSNGQPTLNAGSSIPGYFRHLVLEYNVSAADSGAASGFYDLCMQFNGDTAADYTSHRIQTVNSTTVSAFSDTATTTPRIGAAPAGGVSIIGNSLGGAGVVKIPYYSLANNSKMWTFSAHASSGVGAPNNFQLTEGGGIWGNNTAAITSIAIFTIAGATGNLNTGSHLALYAIP